jgi:hypothetical protein
MTYTKEQLKEAIKEAIRYDLCADIGFVFRGDAEVIMRAAKDRLADMEANEEALEALEALDKLTETLKAMAIRYENVVCLWVDDAYNLIKNRIGGTK